jgi:large repetitive protein
MRLNSLAGMVNLRKNVARLVFRFLAASVLIALSAAGVEQSRAQGTMQAVFVGFPPIMTSPYVADVVQQYEQGRFPLQLIYSTPGALPVSVRLRVVIDREGLSIAEATSLPFELSPGVRMVRRFGDSPEIPFPVSFSDVLNQLSGMERQSVLQAGVLPEGMYQITAELLAEDPDLMVSSVPGSAMFMVRYVQPPILLSPSDQSVVTQSYPMFAWTPVFAPVDSRPTYELVIVEVQPGQTPEMAVIANREHARLLISDRTSIAYTPDQLAMVPGRTYAWRLRAFDSLERIAFVDNGATEVYTFTFTPGGQITEEIATLSTIVLEPGFATLVHLEQVTAMESLEGYRLSGEATLRLATSPAVEVFVDLRDLMIQRGSIANPVILGGEVLSLTGPDMALPAQLASSIRFMDLQWRLGEGFSVAADLDLGEGRRRANGRVRLSSAGLFGEVSLTGAPLAGYAAPELHLDVTSVTVAFPAMRMTGSGSVRMFGGLDGCRVEEIDLLSPAMTTSVSCDETLTTSLASDGSGLSLSLRYLRGDLGVDRAMAALSYDLYASGSVSLQTSPATCGLNVSLRLGHADGVALAGTGSACSSYAAEIDMGVMKARLAHPEAHTISYDRSTGSWNVDLSLSASVVMPALSQSSLPLTRVRVNRDGITFAGLDLSDELTGLAPVEAAGVRLRLRRLAAPGFTIPWASWASPAAGVPAISAAMDVSLTEPPPGFPGCFRTNAVRMDDVRIVDGRFSLVVPLRSAGGCTAPLGVGNALTLTAIDGEFAANVGGSSLALEASMVARGYLDLGEPFLCTGNQRVSLGQDGIRIGMDGSISGTVRGVVPPCDISVGPFSARPTTAELRFESPGETRSSKLAMAAELSVPGAESASGTATVDLLTGRLENVLFELRRFDWRIPAEQPALTFRVENARITDEGLTVDGDQRLLIGNGDIAARFDRLRLDLDTREVVDGSVAVEGAFGLLGQISPGGTLAFSSVASGHLMPSGPAVLLVFESGIEIGPSGLRSRGTVRAALRYEHLDFGSDLRAELSDDFAFGLSPFGIRTGRVDLLYGPSRAAYADAAGFHVDPVYLAGILPDRLPLPHEDVAYLVLRDASGQLVVDAVRDDDGSYRLSTQPQRPAELVIPALSSLGEYRLLVALNGVRVSASDLEILEGEVTAAVAPAIDLTGVGIPLHLKRIRFGEVVSGAMRARGLILAGDLRLFGQDLAPDVELVIGADGTLHGVIDAVNASSRLALVPGSDLVGIDVSRIGGSVSIPLAIGGPGATFDLMLEGDLSLRNPSRDAIASAGLSLRYTPAGLTVERFQARLDENGARLDLGQVGLAVNRIHSLTLTHRSNPGFYFTLGLDMVLSLPASTGRIDIPLQGIELTQSALRLPRQNIHRESTPRLELQPISIGPLALDLLAFTTPGQISFNLYEGEVPDLPLSIDLAVYLPGLSERVPALARTSITVNAARLDRGVFAGDLLPLLLPEPVVIPLAGNDGFALQQIAGRLWRGGTAGNPVQEYEIRLTGTLPRPEALLPGQDPCNDVPITVRLSPEGGLVGSIDDYTPCGTLRLDPARVAFQGGRLDFSVGGGRQEVTFAGRATAVIERPGEVDLRASGDLTVSLLSGAVIDGRIGIDEPFPWSYPRSEPVFDFTVRQAFIDREGFTFEGGGSLDYARTGRAAEVTFSRVNLHPLTGAIRSGEVTVVDEADIEVNLSPIAWRAIDGAESFTGQNAVRLSLGSGVRLDQSGLALAGQGAAAFRVSGQPIDGLRLEMIDFRATFGPTRIVGGRAELYRQQDRIAYYDETGFHLDESGLVASVIPDTLALPTRDIAYLVLRDPDETRFELVSDGGARSLRTRTGQRAELILVGLRDASGSAASMDVTFDLRVDAFFNVTGGSVSLFATHPIDLSPYTALPISLTALSYDSATRELAAAAKVVPPDGLPDLDLRAEVRFGSAGLREGVITAGTYSSGYSQAAATAAPIATQRLGDGALEVNARGFRLAFGAANSVAFSGDLTSSLLRDDLGNITPLYVAAEYRTNRWHFAVDASALNGRPLRVGAARLEPFESQGGALFAVESSAGGFNVGFAAVVTFPDLLGADFRMSIPRLRMGSSGVAIEGFADFGDQHLSLFGGVLDLRTRNMRAEIAASHLVFTMDGSFDFFDRSDLAFEGLRVSSAGTIALAGGETNLLRQPIAILQDDALVFESMRIAVRDNRAELEVTGSVTLPRPLEARSVVTLRANTSGQTSVTGPTFVFDSQYRIGNNPATEFRIGSFATLELTALGLEIDLRRPAQTAYSAAGVIYLANDTSRRLMFGNAARIQQEPGIRYRPGQPVQWNVSSTFNPQTSPLVFDYEFFRVNIASVSVAPSTQDPSSPFEVTIGGRAGLALPGISGEANFGDFRFTTAGVTSAGRFAGGASLTLMGIMALEIGTYESARGENLTLTLTSGGAGGGAPRVEERQVTGVKRYLRFGGGAAGSAVRISLSEAFSGGVDEVLLYETDQGKYLHIKNAHLSLAQAASVSLSMDYVQAGGNFELSAAGSGSFHGTGIAAAGTISTINNQLRFGLFVAAASPNTSVPIIPVLVELSSIGGGFFYRPTEQDLNRVIQTVSQLDQNFALIGEQPRVTNMKFAALISARVDILKTPVMTYVEGSTFLQITDQFTKLDVRATLLQQTNKLYGGIGLTVMYAPGRTGLEGIIMLDARYEPAVAGDAKLNFFSVKEQGQEDPLWGITGNMNMKVLSFLDAKGMFAVVREGMFAELSVNAGADLRVVSAKAGFDLMAWHLPTNSTGGYAEMRIEMSVLGGLAKMGANGKGALINQNPDFLLYLAGQAHVSVLFVFDGTISGWVALKNTAPRLDFGTGSNPRYEQMIADARAQGQQLGQSARETADALRDAQDELEALAAMAEAEAAAAARRIISPADVRLTDEEVRSAGMNLFTLDDAPRRQAAQGILNAERAYYDALFGSSPDGSNVPPIIRWLGTEVLAGSATVGVYTAESPVLGTRPSLTPSSSDRQVSNVRQVFADALAANTPCVLDRLDTMIPEIEALLLAEALQAQTDFSSPVSLSGPMGGGPGSVAVNLGAINQQVEAMEQYREAVGVIDERYREALDAARRNAALVDLASGGRRLSLLALLPPREDDCLSINALSNLYRLTVTQSAHHVANETNRYWRLHDWLLNAHTAVTASSGDITAQIVNDYRRTLPAAADVTYKRKNALLELSGAPPDIAETAREAVRLAAPPTASTQQVLNAGIIYGEAGTDLWIRMASLALPEIADSMAVGAIRSRQAAQPLLAAVQASHREYTQRVERLYALKTDMTATLYAIAEEYLAWRSDVMDDEETRLLADLRDHLVNQLMPPTIEGIEGRVALAGNGRFEVQMNVHHPDEVAEISYALDAVNEPSSGFVTVGTAVTDSDVTKVTHWTPRRERDDSSYSYDMTVRARGSGGNTITRGIRLEVPVRPNTNVAQTVRVNRQDDVTPPEKPVAVVAYPVYLNTYWVADSTRLDVVLRSRDTESDIAGFQYRIGTFAGAGDVLPWTEAVGVLSTATVGSATYVELRASLRAAQIRSDRPYYFTVRAVNGAGLQSLPATLDRPLRFDATPPTRPMIVREQRPPVNVISAETTPADYHPVFDPPQWASVRLASSGSKTDEPLITLEWSAADPETHIRSYEVAVSDSGSEGDDVFFRNNVVATTDARLTLRLDFRQPKYVYVRAINNIGVAGAALVSEPLLATDPTPPSTPIVRAQAAPGGVYLYLTRISEDKESGVAGYQYAITDAITGDTLRGWPRGLIDIAYNASTIGPVQSHFVPREYLEDGRRLLVSVRAVNTQGGASRPSRSGPVRLDSTRPEQPLFAATYGVPDPGMLRIRVDRARDLQSGVARVSYAIREIARDVDPASVNTGGAEADEASSTPIESGVLFSRLAHEPEYVFPAAYYMDKRHLQLASVNRLIEVRVIVRNGTGLTSSSAQQILLPPREGGDQIASVSP